MKLAWHTSEPAFNLGVAWLVCPKARDVLLKSNDSKCVPPPTGRRTVGAKCMHDRGRMHSVGDTGRDVDPKSRSY